MVNFQGINMDSCCNIDDAIEEVDDTFSINCFNDADTDNIYISNIESMYMYYLIECMLHESPNLLVYFNQGTCLLAITQHVSANVHCIIVEFYYFWKYVKMENKFEIYFEISGTKHYGYELYTKTLPKIIFHRNRINILGW